MAHTNCTVGRAVERGHYRCRSRHGREGRCPTFNGWRCREYRPARYRSKTSYQSRTTCVKAARKVVFVYDQPI